jgi:hypothetical protein
MVKLRGQIIHETKDAVRFHITQDECGTLDGQTEWFAKKCTRLPKKNQGTISIYVQCWMYDSKIKRGPEWTWVG